MPGRSFAREPLEPDPTPFHGLRAPGAGPPSRPFLGRQFEPHFHVFGRRLSGSGSTELAEVFALPSDISTMHDR
jgi:hypothetical protein